MLSEQSVTLLLDDVQNLSRFFCGICNEIMLEPTQSECGCRFCYKCVQDFLSKGNSKCPTCNDQNIEKVNLIRDKAIEKEIMNVRINCPNKECGENLIFRQWNDHEAVCKYGVNECEKCGERYVRSKKEDHVKEDCCKSMVKCGDCGSVMSREDLENIHKNYKGDEKNLCDKWMSKCPYKCKENENVSIKNHLKSCLERCSQCPLRDIGCNVEGPQREINLHVKEAGALHQILMLKEIKELKNNKDKISSMFRDKEEAYTLQYEELTKMNEDNEVKVRELQEKVDGMTKYTESLLSELEKFKSRSYFKESQEDIELNLCGATWSIKDIRKKIQEAKCGGKNELISECFYMFRPGYNMSFKVFLNGDGRATNKYLSVFFVVNKGEYDSQISWPFKSRVLLSILSNSHSKKDITVRMKPNNNDECYGKPSGKCNLGAGQPEFVELSEILNKDYYLHEGALKLRFSII